MPGGLREGLGHVAALLLSSRQIRRGVLCLALEQGDLRPMTQPNQHPTNRHANEDSKGESHVLYHLRGEPPHENVPIEG